MTNNQLPNDSNHPKEHKLATYNSWINRMNTLPLNEQNQGEGTQSKI